MYPERINCQIYVIIDLGWCWEFALAEKFTSLCAMVQLSQIYAGAWFQDFDQGKGVRASSHDHFFLYIKF